MFCTFTSVSKYLYNWICRQSSNSSKILKRIYFGPVLVSTRGKSGALANIWLIVLREIKVGNDALAKVAPHYIACCCIALHCVASCYIVLYCVPWYCMVLHCIALTSSTTGLVNVELGLEQRCTGRCHKCHFTNEPPLAQRRTAMLQKPKQAWEWGWKVRQRYHRVGSYLWSRRCGFSYSSCIMTLMRSSRPAE